MSTTLRKDPKAVIPEFIDWFEEPFLTLRPYLVGQPIRIEDYTEDGHYVVRAEVPGVDPEKELEVAVGQGHLSIHVQRPDRVEGRHHSEFRYGAFSRTVEFPAGADADDVTASCANGILTVRVALKGKRPEGAKKIPVTASGK
ncbi:MAG TPA: Hsp20/alpha crystallin family protein [Trebonia sp.]|nr:Hsp20/alpha crystallin family protein [Trebonia sp.]